jgi:hypothetical protein
MIYLDNQRDSRGLGRSFDNAPYEKLSIRCLQLWTSSALAAVLFSVCGCASETESKESVSAEFSYSDCKDGIEEEKAIPDFIPLYTMADSMALEGLQCVSWNHDGEDLLGVDLINFSNGCLPSWNGEAAVDEEGKVSLIVENPTCGMGACGNCIYDWSFKVKGVSAEAVAEVSISVWSYPQEGCEMSDPSDSLTTYAVTIQEADLSSGMVCRYVNPMDLEWLSKVGEAFLYCSQEQPCIGDNLECVSHPDADRYPDASLCLPVCAEDSECPDPTIMSCDETGHCRLTDIWNG